MGNEILETAPTRDPREPIYMEDVENEEDINRFEAFPLVNIGNMLWLNQGSLLSNNSSEEGGVSPEIFERYKDNTILTRFIVLKHTAPLDQISSFV